MPATTGPRADHPIHGALVNAGRWLTLTGGVGACSVLVGGCCCFWYAERDAPRREADLVLYYLGWCLVRSVVLLLVLTAGPRLAAGRSPNLAWVAALLALLDSLCLLPFALLIGVYLADRHDHATLVPCCHLGLLLASAVCGLIASARTFWALSRPEAAEVFRRSTP